MTQQQKVRKGTKTELALALAQGISVRDWAQPNGMSQRTAYRWARDPKVRSMVKDLRRRTVDIAVRHVTKDFRTAADVIMKLAMQSDSDSVRLRAAQTIYSDMIAVAKYSAIEERMAELERRVELLQSAGTVATDSSTGPASNRKRAKASVVHATSPAESNVGSERHAACPPALLAASVPPC